MELTPQLKPRVETHLQKNSNITFRISKFHSKLNFIFSNKSKKTLSLLNKSKRNDLKVFLSLIVCFYLPSPV